MKLRRKKLDYTLCPYYPHPHIMGWGNSGERKIRSNLPLSHPPSPVKISRAAQHTTLPQCSTDPHPHAGKAASKSECANSAVLFIILALEVETSCPACLTLSLNHNLQQFISSTPQDITLFTCSSSSFDDMSRRSSKNLVCRSHNGVRHI